MDARPSETDLPARELVARVATAFGGLFRDMQSLLAGGGSAWQREVLTALVVRGSRLADDLLSYASAQTLAAQPLDPKTLLNALARDLRQVLEARFEIVVRVADDCPACVADAAALRIALLAIVANARDAMLHGGVVQLLAGPARFADGRPAVEFVVRDEGSGIASEMRATATQPFVTTKAGRTSGLGLSAADGLARQSGGNMRLTSSPAGTDCRLLLPARVAAPELSNDIQARGAVSDGVHASRADEEGL